MDNIDQQDHSDIIIIQKKTNDDAHQKTCKILKNHLSDLNLTYKIFTLDDIRTKKLPYFNPIQKTSGLRPKTKLVISLGGDGTLLQTSHYVGNDVRLLGINSAPTTSKGHLCALKSENIVEHFSNIFSNSNYFKNIQRLQVGLNALPICLNDVLICHKHPAATTRIILSLVDRQTNKVEFSQLVYSSGLWIATVAGQTAAISSYNFPKAHEESDTIFVAIREPYFPKNEKKYPSTFSFHSHEKQLFITSKMSSGIICIDGHESCTSFEMDVKVTFNSPKEGILKLIL